MASQSQEPPQISISRTSTASFEHDEPPLRHAAPSSERVDERRASLPRLSTTHRYRARWKTSDGDKPWKRDRTPEPEWKIKWDENCFPNGRVLIIDYISNDECKKSGGKRHIQIAAQELQTLAELKKFYANPRRVHSAALRVVHVQNAQWATAYLLRKFNIDHPNESIGMPGFNTWARYDRPRQRNGKPFPHGRSWREQLDPWRNVARTAFGLDYLKTHPTEAPKRRMRRAAPGERPNAMAKMLHLNAYEDSRSPYGYDVTAQRLSVYVQRSLGVKTRLSPELAAKNPYAKSAANGNANGVKDQHTGYLLEYLDNTNTVIVFEASTSSQIEDSLIQPREETENRWRRLSFYLREDDVVNDNRMAAQCTNMILMDIFHTLATTWDKFLYIASDHVALLEDKIYENPADESRAPELWTNQASWSKVDKIMYIHTDIVREMRGHMRDLSAADGDDTIVDIDVDWLSGTTAEYDRLSHMVQDDLVLPTNNLSDLMYKSVGIRDSRQSLQLSLSMWRLSWITFIFLPLTFIVSFFGMNVDIFQYYPSIGWYFLAAVILMIFVLGLWYCVKHSLQRRRQTPYQRGLYETLYNRLEDQYPDLWSGSGALPEVQPTTISSRFKWRLIKRWFAPEKTVNKRLYSSLAPDGDTTELGAWANFKRKLLERWLPQINRSAESSMPLLPYSNPASPTQPDAMLSDVATLNDVIAPSNIPARPTSSSSSANAAEAVKTYEAETLTVLAPTTPPVNPTVPSLSTYGLRPLRLRERRRISPPPSGAAEIAKHEEEGSGDERRSSRGSLGSSGGVMIEERNLSDSESDVEVGSQRGSIGMRGSEGRDSLDVEGLREVERER